MSKRPDVPCAGCGELLWGGGGSLPLGARCCRRCRLAGLALLKIQQPSKRSDRTCDVVECTAKHMAKGLCRRHYYQSRWAAGLDGAVTATIGLDAICRRWSASAPKVKVITCLRTVGIMPICPMCGSLMRTVTPDHFICARCWVDAEFNPEEVAWLASSDARSMSR